tara:strand:+ start:1187 stop:1522 length:336 start_codon:yes stop_codon:yes gene_type:complete
LRLNNFEALESQTVNWLNWNNLWVGVHKQSLDLYPFFLFFSEVMSSLPLLDFFIELINNNGNKQVHNKESGQENKDDVDQSNWRIMLNNLNLIVTNLINSLEHHSWPHFEC